MPAKTARVDQRSEDSPSVFVDDGAHSQLAAAGEGQYPVDAVGQAAKTGEHGQQLVADHGVAVEDR